MTSEYIQLEEYAKCVQKCLENILYDHQMADDEKPRVVYATAPVAYAKMQEHFKNGSNVGPLITFYQSGIEVDHNVQMGAWKIMPVIRDEGNYLFKAPIICRINYTVTINALTELQADLLQVQLMQATPFHRPYYTKFNGQFVLIESTDFRNLGSVDVGENKDKITQREISLFIDRAYLYYDIKELNAGTISPNKNDSSSYEISNALQEKIENMLDNGEKIFDINGEEVVFDGSYDGELFKERLFDINGNKIGISEEEVEGRKIVQRLKNGEVIYADGETSGIITKNTSMNGYSPFNYNVLDENGKVIETTQKGKLKVTLYSLEGVKK